MRRSKHNLNHYRLYTANMGELVPVGVTEVLPGDSFRHSTSLLVRLAPLVTPVMHPVHVKVHHWYVPNRLVWDDWEDFITDADTTTFPTVNQASYGAGSVLDHMGIPPGGTLDVNALPLYAYNLIWNEYYRDQDIDTERSLTAGALARARWEKDYFTTCRASPQQGTAVEMSFSSGTAPVQGIGIIDTPTQNGGTVWETDASSTQVWTNAVKTARDNTTYIETDVDGKPLVYADLSGASGGILVEEMRRAFARQRFAEARNRFGSRYVDYLRFLGIRPSDGRLDRPEYLGGGKQTINFSEVLATAEGTSTDVGQMFGHGIAGMRTRPYRRFFEEHGHVISLAVVRPRALYQQAIHRNWLRTAKDDYWQKENEAEGMQAVPKAELYGLEANATNLFGYQDRYEEYRRLPSYVSGTFRTSTDDSWHMARTFSSSPSLNSSFLECEPTDRVYQDTEQQELYVMASHQISARRLVRKRARI